LIFAHPKVPDIPLEEHSKGIILKAAPSFALASSESRSHSDKYRSWYMLNSCRLVCAKAGHTPLAEMVRASSVSSITSHTPTRRVSCRILWLYRCGSPDPSSFSKEGSLWYGASCSRDCMLMSTEETDCTADHISPEFYARQVPRMERQTFPVAYRFGLKRTDPPEVVVMCTFGAELG